MVHNGSGLPSVRALYLPPVCRVVHHQLEPSAYSPWQIRLRFLSRAVLLFGWGCWKRGATFRSNSVHPYFEELLRETFLQLPGEEREDRIE